MSSPRKTDKMQSAYEAYYASNSKEQTSKTMIKEWIVQVVPEVKKTVFPPKIVKLLNNSGYNRSPPLSK
jgi:hypothetical protein